MDERAEMEQAVGQALGAIGVRGTVSIDGKSIDLVSDGPPTSIDIEIVVRQWPLLPEEMKRRKAAEIAERLAVAQRSMASAAGRPAPPRGLALPPRFWIAVGAGLGLLVLIGVGRMIFARVGGEKVEQKPAAQVDTGRKDRLARACEAMRDRLYSGASYGPFATEGWVVELWLASSKGAALRGHQALTSIVANGKLTAAGDDELAAVRDGAVEITDGFSDEMGQRAGAWTGVTLIFREGYARAFLEESTRLHYVMLADRLADATGADAGALYARCGHLTSHDLGAWFRGPDAAGAATAMLYQMGFFAESALVDRGALAAQQARGDLEALRKAAEPVEDSLGRIVLGNGGTVSTAHGTAFVFPLSAPMRAIAATRATARKMGVGVGSD